MIASQVRDELLQAEHVLDTKFSFDEAEPFYRRCLAHIESAPQDREAIEQLLIKLFRERQISSEPLAYLMHVLRWEGVRHAIEADLLSQTAPIVAGVEHGKVLDGFETEWDNKMFYRFS
jgi:hypothetical protein